MNEVYVKARGSFLQNLDIEKAGEIVIWEWKTAAHDIAFQVYFTPAASTAATATAIATAATSAAPSSSRFSISSSSKSRLPKSASFSNSSNIIVVPHSRIDKADQLLQHGSYTATGPGTIYLVWDNSYSWIQGKNLSYMLALSDAATERTNLPYGVTRATMYGPAVIEGRRESDGIYLCRLPYGRAYLDAETLLAGPDIGANSVNERCIVGVDLFFNNRVKESEDFFKKEMKKFPMFALAYGSLAFLKGVMTWQKEDLLEAASKLKDARHFVEALLPKEDSMAQSLTKFVTRQSSQSNVNNHDGSINNMTMSVTDLEHTLIAAETYILQANLLFTEESLISLMKAGLKIRSSWKLYEKCDIQLSKLSSEQTAKLDRSVVGGIQFGIGTFNTFISILPAVMLRVVSALGFPSDHHKGLSLLHACFLGRGVRSPLSSLILLSIHIIVPSFFSVRIPFHAAKAHGILAICFEKYSEGAMFWWMAGRLSRMERDLPGAIRAFQRSAKGGEQFVQLQHVCAYELGFCYLFSLQYDICSSFFARLEKENSWSKAFFAYVQAVCALDSPTVDATQAAQIATPIFERVEKLVTRKIGGKVISIEQFVIERANQFLKGKKKPVLPTLEIIYLFYGFIQMSADLLVECQQRVENLLQQASSMSTDDHSLCLLVYAGILKARKLRVEAEKQLVLIEQKESDIKEHYIIPFARFEVASLWMEELHEKDQARKGNQSGTNEAESSSRATSSSGVNRSSSSSSPRSSDEDSNFLSYKSSEIIRIRTQLKRAQSYSHDFHFKNRLHFRVHLAQTELKMLAVNWAELHGNTRTEAEIKEEEKLLGELPKEVKATAEEAEGADDD